MFRCGPSSGNDRRAGLMFLPFFSLPPTHPEAVEAGYFMFSIFGDYSHINYFMTQGGSQVHIL